MYRNRLACSPRAQKHILIIEDNPDGRESLRLLLSILGHEVETAADGVEGVRKALALRPDIVLSDIGMPRMDGYEAASRIRAALGPNVVLLACTAYDDDEAKWRSAEAGFNAHLVKPIELRELTRWLDAENISSDDLCPVGGAGR